MRASSKRRQNEFLDDHEADLLTAPKPPADTHVGSTPWTEFAATLSQSLGSTAINAPITANLDQIDWDAYVANPLYRGIDGRGLTIAIIDSGIDQNHAAFAGGRIAYQYDFVDGDTIAQDDNGHGTHVASIAGGLQAGVFAGVATGVQFVVLKVLGADGSGSGTSILNALKWVEQNAATYNIAAVNMSIGFGVNDSSNRTDFLSSTLKSLHDKGIASVGAAGNDYRDFQFEGVDYPGSDPWSWAIGAVHSSGSFNEKLAAFSQRSGTMMDMTAPGVSVAGARAGGGYVNMSGTSMATPAVTGAVALAQHLATEISGSRLDVETVRTLMRAGASVQTDNEIADGVRNTGKQYLRLDIDDMLAKVVTYFQTSTTANDRLWGWRADDTISGGAGDDTISGGDGADVLDGGDGNDLAAYDHLDWQDGIIQRRADGTFTIAGDTLRSIERVKFKDGIVRDLANPNETPAPPPPPEDTPPPAPPAEEEPGSVVLGTHENDWLVGSAGNDSIYAGAGNDTITGGAGSDMLDGGAGKDLVVYEQLGYSADIVTRAADGSYLVAGDTLRNIEFIRFSDGIVRTLGGDFGPAPNRPTSGDDLLTGNSAGNRINGLSGDDTVYGLAGNDRIFGAAGDDDLHGDDGRDTLWGGDGNDQIWGGAGNDWLYGGPGTDTIDGGDGDDTAVLHNSGAVNVVVFKNALETPPTATTHLHAVETVIGSRGNDHIIGDETATRLLGSRGSDTIDGGDGADTLDGGAHNDILTGGEGSDRFVFTGNWGNDSITDLSADDVMDFTSVRGLSSVNQFIVEESETGLDISLGRATLHLADVDIGLWKALIANDQILV